MPSTIQTITRLPAVSAQECGQQKITFQSAKITDVLQVHPNLREGYFAHMQLSPGVHLDLIRSAQLAQVYYHRMAQSRRVLL